MVQNEKKLLEKINILCLMEIIFRYVKLFLSAIKKQLCRSVRFLFLCSRASEDRTIPLNVIADRTKLSVEDVEYLLMKSLSVSLLIMLRPYILSSSQEAFILASFSTLAHMQS